MDSFVRYSHRAQFYETDQMGIIHHSNYIRWFEEARIDLLDQIGFSYRSMEEAGISIPVLAVTCTFKSMVRFWDTVYIVPRVESFSGTRLTISYSVIDASTSILRATGQSQHCFLDSKGIPMSLQKKNVKAFQVFQDLVGLDL
jgi:acyl-CoA thioester hydrolase